MELEMLKKANEVSTSKILEEDETASTSGINTPPLPSIAEARQRVADKKRPAHAEFGGKCPKDVHVACNERIAALEAEVDKLRSQLEVEHKNGVYQ